MDSLYHAERLQASSFVGSSPPPEGQNAAQAFPCASREPGPPGAWDAGSAGGGVWAVDGRVRRRCRRRRSSSGRRYAFSRREAFQISTQINDAHRKTL